MTSSSRLLLAAALFAGTALSAPAASAASIVGLVDGKSLVMVDPQSRKVTKTVQISGTDTLVGIDVRPADGMLYGLTASGSVVTIDPASGKATEKSKLKTMLPNGSNAVVDFNPVADALRVMGSDGTNLRAKVDEGNVTTDGSLKFAETDMHKGEKPNIVAGAYTNSMKGAKETTLYNLDATIPALIKQAPPNDGILNAVGKLGVKVDGPTAFNIVAGEGMKNDAWLVTGGTLYRVDLESGKTTEAGKIEGVSGKLTDIAWWDGAAM